MRRFVLYVTCLSKKVRTWDVVKTVFLCDSNGKAEGLRNLKNYPTILVVQNIKMHVKNMSIL